ncbi:MAG: SDR family NAD(P)-dependent oxidoreductase [Paracoccaceae bacterium]
MSFSIEGRTAIVTGAANGIGAAIARHFAHVGANVVLADRDEAALKARLEEADHPERMRIHAGDLRERLTLANLISVAADAFDRVHILVNAARQVLPSDPLNPDDDAVRTMLDQNLMPALRLTQEVARRMIRDAEDDPDGPAGVIVNMSSIAAQRSHPELLGYSVAAASVDQMTRSMAIALAPHRIRVNAVAFGSVMSESLRGALADDRATRSDIVDATPLARIARAGEVPETVQYLASDSASFVTGQVITVDGGRTLVDPVGAAAH